MRIERDTMNSFKFFPILAKLERIVQFCNRKPKKISDDRKSAHLYGIGFGQNII